MAPPPGATPPAGATPPEGAAPPDLPAGFAPPSGVIWSDVDVKRGAPRPGRSAPEPVAQYATVGPIVNDGWVGNFSFMPSTYSAKNGNSPDGVEPLERDIFTSDDFYVDKEHWTDPRYYRCASPNGVEEIWGAVRPQSIGDNFPTSVPWGMCDVDYPVKEIVSPYGFATAQEQYVALLADVQTRGGPNKTPPDWIGVYDSYGFGAIPFTTNWYGVSNIQASTFASLLTPEYRQRFVQQMWHDAHNNLQWPGAYCWPEGYGRWWFDNFRWIVTTPDTAMQFGRISDTLFSQVMLNGKFDMSGSVPNLLGDTRQWYGDTIGFWDGDILITWTSNIRGWIAHGRNEFSDNMQAIDIYYPITRKDNGKLAGLQHETIMYDPDTFLQPVRIVENLERARGMSEGRPYDLRECIQTLFPINGQQAPVAVGETIQFTVPDMNGRPLPDLWALHESDMKRPAVVDVLSNY
jgi:hypothetical protein